ncbi:phosphate/phosphite/phosphonate ABC transporter substrate-binding protein [Bradyrhizobium sp. INPA01-394B]|uniref:PhnD/SsuA/transferrin family substrate-binding protein n=2 Tax=Bradyrhizobium campsiandrae TaxID=1729892 RepID=A0ABR7U0W1_9BRAD|nr:PhnD/SsuA/transferrin family substrate-binding protein [Bradyrhizobium campsiandrae]MBC9878710.1 phosphate/phosphite/phosphonate ABC transporter substrate-binding protein [Bradyrhizobium campsiandrae]MBC9977190.1 PhnD/SsuA/transferrin family substrate-binding protein [Bradyrhizobium campsiandrae]
MYSAAPAAAVAWTELFDWLARESGVTLDVIDHAFPLPLSDLWARRDLAAAFMCGFPFMLSAERPRPVAAPVPSGALYQGRPVYATHLVVRADSRFQSLEDTFGGRLGFTVPDSHSGYNALRHHLVPYFRRHGARLYRESVGPLTTPRRVIAALLDGEIDVGPLDSYALDLILRHDPPLASQIRIVATTDLAPIPFLVAAAACPDDIVAKLQAALRTFATAPACASLRDRLCLDAFAAVQLADYELTLRWDAEARAAGYATPG